jgi:RNA polymerase sigma-32 factor
MMDTFSISAPIVDQNLNRYFKETWKFPILEKQHEHRLACAWINDEDSNAAHALVTSHLRLVAKIAMGFKGYGLPMADLVAEGNIGLMKAVKKFDPYLGFRLSTYAMWWIRAAITEYILRSWSLVKIGTVASQKRLFFKLRKIKSHLKITDNVELTPDQVTKVAAATKTSHNDVIQMNRRLAGRDLSLNAPISPDDEPTEFQDKLVDKRPSPEAIVADREEFDYRSDILNNVIDTLPERERQIFVERRLSESPRTLSELGKQYNVSRERIRQLEVRAFHKVEKAMHNKIAELQQTV